MLYTWRRFRAILNILFGGDGKVKMYRDLDGSKIGSSTNLESGD